MGPPPEPLEGTKSANTPTLDFWPPGLGGTRSLWCLGQNGGNLLQQPQEPNTEVTPQR